MALLFASQVSSSSLQSSVGELSHGIAGDATLQLLARDPQGFPQSMLARVRAIPGVRVAAPLLEASANAIGPRGSESVELVGADSSLAKLGGTLVRHAALTPFGGVGAIVLPAPLATRDRRDASSARKPPSSSPGTPPRRRCTRSCTQRQIGALIGSPVAIAPLVLRAGTGRPGRSREPHPRAARAPAPKRACARR